MSTSAPSRFSAEGTNTGDFDSGDWGLLLLTSLIWGSSFLWIAIGLDAFGPGVIACGRMLLGAAVLWWFPASRIPVPRKAWSAVAVVAIAGNTFPAVFFPLAQQRVESSVAGMFNSVGPILTLVISVAMLRAAPPRGQIGGLLVGMVGALLLGIANLSGADAEPLGLLFIILAVTGYSVSNNFLPALAQNYGGPAVIARAMTASALLLLPWGLLSLDESSFRWSSFGALVVLGVLGTGLARTVFAILNGRIGAPRSALVGYLVPVVAVLLGVLVRDESVSVLELVGTALILVGAALISRARH
ncbi:MAG: DMT family transporter [Actinomycetota bacterium]